MFFFKAAFTPSPTPRQKQAGLCGDSVAEVGSPPAVTPVTMETGPLPQIWCEHSLNSASLTQGVSQIAYFGTKHLFMHILCAFTSIQTIQKNCILNCPDSAEQQILNKHHIGVIAEVA